MTTENEKPPLPPKAEDSAARIATALAALQETQSKPSGEPVPATGGGEPVVPTVPGKKAEGDPPPPVPAVAADAPEVRIARGLVAGHIKAALSEHAVDLRAVEFYLKDQGAAVGLDDAGKPALQLKDGRELPVSFEALKEAGIPESLLKSRGKPGTGFQEAGTPGPGGFDMARSLTDFDYFEKHKSAILEQRRKTRTSE